MKAVVFGAGGFIGHHLVRQLKDEGYEVLGVDLKFPEFGESFADEFLIADLRNPAVAKHCAQSQPDEVYQLAADMGGAGFIFTGQHDADIMHNSALININVAQAFANTSIKRILFTSSACVYPAERQADPEAPDCRESSAYPANPDSDYGWEKLFSERLYQAYARNYQLPARIARLHNVFGPFGCYQGGREKAPAALCRKVALAQSGDSIELWGDGQQTRSFLFISECIEGLRRLMRSSFAGPVNLGSAEMITLNELALIIIEISGKHLSLNHISGPLGVRGRTSNNDLIYEQLAWKPHRPLRHGLEILYHWIESQVHGAKHADTKTNHRRDWHRPFGPVLGAHNGQDGSSRPVRGSQ